MHREFIQDRALLYVAGDLAAPEREALEVLMEFRADLREEVAALQAGAAAVMLVPEAPGVTPPVSLKARVIAGLDAATAGAEREALVATDPAGRVEWVNPAFTAMCGFSLEELKGNKPGRLLQGAATDPVVVDRIRSAIRQRRACCETLVNYHKDGTRYRAEVRITPVLDDDNEPVWFVARERKLAE